MRAVNIILLLAAVATASDNGWRSGKQYIYQMTARSLAALHQVDNQYSGVVIRAQVEVLPKSASELLLQVKQPQYAEVHRKLPQGWQSYIPERELSFQQLPMSGKAFQLSVNNGVVRKLAVSAGTPAWEVNMIKGIASQFQVNTLGQNLISSKLNRKPNPSSATAFYRTMEKSVTGECETAYDISPLPAYQVQSEPQLAPLALSKAEENLLLDIVKTKNFSNCDQRVGYNWGISGLSGPWESASNKGSAFARSSVARVIIQGNLKEYVIHSSVITNKAIMSPTLYGQQKGIVASRLNLTLAAVNSASGSPEEPSNPWTTDLVYEYNNAFGQEREKNDYSGSAGESSSSSSEIDENQRSADSQSSSSSDESDQMAGNVYTVKNQQSGESPRHPRFLHSATPRPTADASSSSSSSSSSSEQNYQPTPSMDQPPSIPLLPYFVGYKGKAINESSQVNTVNVVTKLAEKIGNDVQNPNNLPKQNTLAKFIILSRVTRIASYKQLQEATRKLYTPSKSSSSSKSHASALAAWKAFRDAVAQAGTGPALETIKDWIRDGKVQGEEAAELVAILPNTARTPTTQYVDALFDLSTKSYVQKQPLLNTSAIMAFTHLVRKVLVDNTTAQNYFSAHVFGRLTPRNSNIVQNKYIPHFGRELNRAVQENDSPKIQVYIRALGNIAHPNILNVFEPYLEGKQPSTDFQRLLMVTSLNDLAVIYPSIARQVLFKIYQNAAEAHEVRCGAVFLIMKTNPPVYMLQRMAQFTNHDQSNHVNSAVKSAIESAASLKGPQNAQLTMNAQAAADLLNPKTYGLHYPKTNMMSNMLYELKAAYRQSFSYTTREDSMLPNTFSYTVRRNRGGFKSHKVVVRAMVSSAKDFINYFYDVIGSNSGDRHSSSGSRVSKTSENLSSEQIADMLGIETDDADQLEGNIQMQLLGASRFFAYDNHTIERIPEAIQYFAAAFRPGRSFNITKFYNPESITIAFPNPIGLINQFSIKNPKLIQIGGEANLRFSRDLTRKSSSQLWSLRAVNVSADLNVLLSSQYQSQISVMLPFNSKRYIAGVERNMQIYLPIRAEANADLVNQDYQITAQPVDKNSEYSILHLSSLPYTSQHNILNFEPVTENRNTKKIHIREPKQYHTTLGQESTGIAFKLNYESESDFTDFQKFKECITQHDAISWIQYPFAQQNIHHYQMELKYDPRESSASSVLVTASYGDNEGDEKQEFEENQSGKNKDKSDEDDSASANNAAIPTSTSPDSDSRQQQFLNRAAAGIKSASAALVDLSIQFNGQTKAQYIATAAYADSPVDSKTRLLLFASKTPAHPSSENQPLQMCLAVNGDWASVPMNNFKKALRADPSSSINAQLSLGEKCSSGVQIDSKCNLKQSDKRQQYLKQHPLAKLCEDQMTEGNYWLPACRNVTVRANFIDQYECSAHFQNVPAPMWNNTYKAYSVIRYLGYNYLDEDVISPSGSRGRAYLSANFSSSLKSVNVSIQTASMTTEFKNVRLNPYVRPWVVVHPQISAVQRFARKVLRAQNEPTCVVDATNVNTFDNKTYPIELGKCWHVMLTTAPKGCPESNSDQNTAQENNATVLIRDASSNQREVKIIAGGDILDLTPSSSSSSQDFDQGPSKAKSAANLEVNGRPSRVSRNNLTEVDGQYGTNLVQATVLPSGALYVNLPNYGFDMTFDGLRIKITANNSHRGEVRGLCGTFTGETATDFTTPKNCILRRPELFAASYALTQLSCTGPAKENQRRSQNAPCYEQAVLLGDVISKHETEAISDGSTSSSSSSFSSSSSSSESSSSSSSESYESQRGSNHQKSNKSQLECTDHKVKVLKENGQICFSQQPLPKCRSQCSAQDEVYKKIPFHCIAESEVARRWASNIEKGANPDFSRKQTHMTKKVPLPLNCQK